MAFKNPPLFDVASWNDMTADDRARAMLTEVTLRDLFAAFALNGYCASETEESHFASREAMAAECYARADAMLAERAKGGA